MIDTKVKRTLSIKCYCRVNIYTKAKVFFSLRLLHDGYEGVQKFALVFVVDLYSYKRTYVEHIFKQLAFATTKNKGKSKLKITYPKCRKS